MLFKDIFGHERQIALLKGFMEQDRLPHALLFSGTEGIGKRTTALVFAKALNCLTGNYDACDDCSSCHKVDHKNHLDVIILEAEGQFIKIKAVRELQQQLKFKPWEGKKRVCIIDDAEKMNDVAANALLKTLEEPPSSNVIIIISAQPHKLPATVVSRCQQLRFNPLAEDDIVSFLKERFSLETEAAQVLASSSGGSISKALELHSGAYLSMRNELMEMISGEQMLSPLPLMRLSLVRRFGDDRDEVLERLGILRMCCRDVLFYKETGEKRGLINPDRMDVIGPLAEKLPVKEIINNIKTIDKTLRAVELSADRTLALEVMMLRFVS
jgi:DNA polymerase-3 subunit delta'